MKMRNLRFKNFVLRCTLCAVLCTLLGCEAFVRKFTRKPQKQDSSIEDLVLVPEEYASLQISKDELYQKYFLYWKSWQDELIASLYPGSNHKKQIDCVNEALNNLAKIKGLLRPEINKQVDVYLAQLENLKGLISKDLYSNNTTNNRTKAEQLKRNILRDLSYKKIKDRLI